MQILEATLQVALERGLHDLRVADVAAALEVSTGLIHYHFSTKDELVEEMLLDTSQQALDHVVQQVDKVEGAVQRLDVAIEDYLPADHRDPWWVLWIDVWGEALRDATMRRISEDFDKSWVDVFERIVAEGIEEGVFHGDDARSAAWRLCALLDGLALQVVLHQRTMTRREMGAHVRVVAARELGFEPVVR